MQYVAGVASLPADLQRNYGLLGQLDQQYQELQRHMQEICAQGHKDVTEAAESAGSQLEVLVRKHTQAIQEAHKACLDVADHKVALASQTYDLVDSHIQRLDKDLKKFEEELRREQVLIGGPAAPVQRPENLTQLDIKAGRNKGQPFIPAVQMEIDLPVDPNEPTYCYCNRVSYGEMIACDNPECKIEWFHFDCVGIVVRPRGKWYCTDCSTLMKRRRGK